MLSVTEKRPCPYKTRALFFEGQMTILMRQAGLRVPHVQAPTREDWIEKGMKPYA